jgi:MFS family permease
VASPTGGRRAEESTRLLRAVYGATFFIRFAFGLTVSVFAAYITGHFSGLSASEVGAVGAITSAAPIGEFTTVLASGVLADRRGRFPVLLGGMIGGAIIFLAVSFTRADAALTGANFLFGVASGAILAASLAVVGDRAERDERGAAMGRFDAMNLLGWVLGFAVGLGILGEVPNALLPWLFRAGAGVLLLGLVFAIFESRGLREAPSRRQFHLGDIRRAVLRRDVLVVALPWLVIYMLVGTGLSFLGSAGSGIGVPPWELALLIGGGGLVLLLSQPYFGRLADRYGTYRLMVVGTAGFLGLMGSLAAISAFGPRPELLGAAGVSVLAALAYGPAALSALAGVSQRTSRGTTMAVYSLVISAGMILGLLGSSELYSRYQLLGLDIFFGSIGAALVALTIVRGWDLSTGRVPAESRG